MSRSSKNVKRTRTTRRNSPLLLSALTAAALGSGFPAATAHAAGYVYQQHIVNAGVLVNDAVQPIVDPSPYVFYVLNNRPDVRPTDLTLVNPLAPASATPNTPRYWEVPLNASSDSELAQYNVLYLRADGISFGPIINEKLRRFVDNGGQLIVEYEGAAAKVGLFTGTGVTGTSAGATISVPPVGSAFLLHPIVSQPYLLSQADLNTLGVPPFSLNPNTADVIHTAEFNNIFSPALNYSGTSVVATAQIGAGQVVASTLNLGVGIGSALPVYTDPVTSAVEFNPANLYVASTPELKLLANILTWAQTHPSENKTSHGNAASAGLASFSPAWQYSVTPPTGTPTAPSGAAVWGNFVFAVDAAGTLHAFDAYPSENLTGGANAAGAEQVVPGLSQYPATSYDEIWNQSGFANASAPTVGASGGVNYVFVEKNDGTVVAFNAVTGAASFTLTPPATGGNFTGHAPGPTYYDGRLYAGQANGTLHVYDLNEGTSSVVTLDPSPPTGGSEFVTAAPSVGTLKSGNTNVIVAVVPTPYNIYTVLLGARNEALRQYETNGAIVGYSINRLGNYDLNNIFADLNAVPPLDAYDYNGNFVSSAATSTAPNPQDPLFPITNTAGYFTDWNMDFAASAGNGTTPNPVNLNYISASSYGELNSPTAALAFSAPAIDRSGDYYYTETMEAGGNTNSYVVGVANAPLHSNVHIKFRFLMPTAPLADADKVDYTPLVGFHFVGAPVVDDQNNVYVAAVNGTEATVLCFRGDQQVSAILPTGSNAIDLTQQTYTQPDEGGGGEPNTIQRGPDTNVGAANATYGQFIASTNSISFYNFGKRGRTFAEIAGNLTEPQPITATSTDGMGATNTLLMQTNLAWYVNPFTLTPPASGTTAGAITGLSLVGSSLFLCDGASLYRLATNPQVSTGKVVNTLPSVTAIGAGQVGAPPSVGGSVMVINGTNGIAARTRQVTVIADNNRVLGVDGDGSAVWSVDATTRTDLTSNPTVSSKVALNHPTGLSQFAINDYLVADSGTNRCVRFDSGGNVQWELTRFQDPNGLMALGQPLTLNQPSSVVTRTVNILPTAAANPGGTIVYYLVADSGNGRVLEVADEFDKNGAIFQNFNHYLTWVSHTGDQDGRRYRYGSATYYPYTTTSANGTVTPELSIAATVTNTRLAPLVANPNTTVGGTLLGPVSGDAPGGSIAVFNYPLQQGAASYANLASVPSDLAFTVAGFYTATAGANGATYAPFTIRNPRFLQFYTPTGTATAAAANVPTFNFLYADDNGAFDLTYDATRKAFVAGPDRLQYTQPQYQIMSYTTTSSTGTSAQVPVPALGVSDMISGSSTATSVNLRQNLPFIPTCIQALSTDTQTAGGSTVTTRRYLITQNYSQGELGNVNTTTTGTGTSATTTTTGKLGGEIFEVDVAATGSAGSPGTVTGTLVTTPGGFAGNETLSHPALTGPLTQPTYAVRLP